jgi:alanine-glyoxylate transaminase / serine-glyoxylate transaminase / serine-pyruvate transaminase
MPPQTTMKRIPGHRFLHAPGPTHLPHPVVEAMSRQPLDHGDPRLLEIVAACETGLKSVLQTRRADVFLYAANGHGAWEAAIVNLLSPGAKVLVPGTGHFSESWAMQCQALGAQVVRTPWIEGLPLDPAAIEAVLRADTGHEIVAVFTVHTDTASGITNELAPIRAAMDAAGHPALFVVDVVASLGAMPFDMDALRANVVIGASQKGLMCTPGLGFCAVDAQAMEVAQRNPYPRFYWDWIRRKAEHTYLKFCGTAPQNLLMGLEVALRLIAQEGLDAVFARHRRIAAATQAAVQRWSTAGTLGFFSQLESARSVSITAITVTPGVDVEGIRTVARERFQVAFAGGLGPLAGRIFRIGHLGDINEAMILGSLAGIEAAMTAQGVPYGPNGVAAAVASLAGADRP